MSEFSPGDLAMVTCSDGNERRALCGKRWLDDGRAWIFQDGSRRDAETSDARPLVVIDPEDREQVNRLCEHWFDGEEPGEESISDMQAALRSLITPPKPEEPTGLGAVVEDADGIKWVLHTENTSVINPWQRAGTTEWRTWNRVDAVKVLSEGVAQ